jgi:FkbM family methyltransferase
VSEPTRTEYQQAKAITVVEHAGKAVSFATPNRVTRTRAETLFTKEPDTIAWIHGMEQDAVLFDVGANVGMYTIWAAAQRGVTVYAFEPEALNYAILNQNIQLNRLDKLVCAYCVAIAEQEKFDRLYLAQFGPGGSCHNFAESLDPSGEARTSVFVQGAFAMSIDALIARHGLPVPNYLKIDVDGIEPKVIAGASATLTNPLLRSVLIEINTNVDAHWDIVDRLLDAGFTYSQEQVERAQRKSGPFQGVGNYVFRR